MSHTCGFSPVWVSRHISHMYYGMSIGASSVHNRVEDYDCFQDLPHICYVSMVTCQRECTFTYSNVDCVEMLQGCSQVWVCICSLRSQQLRMISWWITQSLNHITHMSLVQGLSLVWVYMRTSKLSQSLNQIPQVSHLYGLSFVWIHTWSWL